MTTTNSEDTKGSFQDRVNQLTRRASDAERVASATVAENTELRQQMQRLEQQIASLSTRPVPTAPSPQGPSLSEADKPVNFEALTEQITKSVLGAVNPVIEKIQKKEADEQLATVQQQSFLRARAVHPELAQPDSDLFKTFATLWNGRQDLQKVEGSPEILAEAAKGLLSDQHASEQVRKMAAAAHTPKGARQIDLIDKSDEEIKGALDTLVHVGENEGWNSDEFNDYLTLKFKQKGRGQ